MRGLLGCTEVLSRACLPVRADESCFGLCRGRSPRGPWSPAVAVFWRNQLLLVFVGLMISGWSLLRIWWTSRLAKFIGWGFRSGRGDRCSHSHLGEVRGESPSACAGQNLWADGACQQTDKERSGWFCWLALAFLCAHARQATELLLVLVSLWLFWQTVVPCSSWESEFRTSWVWRAAAPETRKGVRSCMYSAAS